MSVVSTKNKTKFGANNSLEVPVFMLFMKLH